MTEMSIKTALEYARWINDHARLFISMNHENNLFTVADLAKSSLAANAIYQRPVPWRLGYYEEAFAIDRRLTNLKVDLFLLRSKALVRFCQKAVGWVWRRAKQFSCADRLQSRG